jgi:hypothetical protein
MAACIWDESFIGFPGLSRNTAVFPGERSAVTLPCGFA